ncbi:uncharacterized protein LOC109806497 isoform X2 [Cajanus cajan]|uniref:uncharacterized protein LOC109806497 isoform X2 n=1 Tax=Cajanus cajan TaxID=3821 RepID=UPI00098D7893|nr:uncharacterized protein LOC109806497 isoform X2 [Cajanus cajan]
MDLNFQNINWVGNIYQKFEAVCQEVDDIVSQDAVKYLENHVQNVGDNVKKFYSGVVNDLLPFPTLAGSKYESHSVDLTNNTGFSAPGHKDNNNKRDEENPINNFIKPLQNSNAIDINNNQQAGVPIKQNLVNEVSVETCYDSPEVGDSYITQEEVGDDSSETSGADKKENLHTSIEEVAVEPVPKHMDLISVREKGSLEFPIHSESNSDSLDSGCEVLIRTKDNVDVNAGQNSCLIVEEISMNSSTSQLSSSQSLDEEESIKVSLFSESSDVVYEATHCILDEVSPNDSVSCESPVTKTEPLCFKSTLASDSLYSKPLRSYSFEIECCQNNSDKSLASSIESILEDIQLNDDPKLEESCDLKLEESCDLKLEQSCVFVDDSELYAVSSRAQKLRSYKKRIKDAFASKKRLAKEYEQLAIWYGDTDIEPSQGSSQILLPFGSRKYMDSKNLQVQQASETEWELL